MDVLSRSEKQKIVTSTIIASLFGAITIFAVMLLMSASQLSNATGIQTGSIGPIQLFELFKNPVSTGGYSAGLSFSSGIMVYAFIWLCLGIFLIATRLKLLKDKEKVA